jgi:hypothetical protein
MTAGIWFMFEYEFSHNQSLIRAIRIEADLITLMVRNQVCFEPPVQLKSYKEECERYNRMRQLAVQLVLNRLKSRLVRDILVIPESSARAIIMKRSHTDPTLRLMPNRSFTRSLEEWFVVGRIITPAMLQRFLYVLQSYEQVQHKRGIQKRLDFFAFSKILYDLSSKSTLQHARITPDILDRLTNQYWRHEGPSLSPRLHYEFTGFGISVQPVVTRYTLEFNQLQPLFQQQFKQTQRRWKTWCLDQTKIDDLQRLSPKLDNIDALCSFVAGVMLIRQVMFVLPVQHGERCYVVSKSAFSFALVYLIHSVFSSVNKLDSPVVSWLVLLLGLMFPVVTYTQQVLAEYNRIARLNAPTINNVTRLFLLYGKPRCADHFSLLAEDLIDTCILPFLCSDMDEPHDIRSLSEVNRHFNQLIKRVDLTTPSSVFWQRQLKRHVNHLLYVSYMRVVQYLQVTHRVNATMIRLSLNEDCWFWEKLTSRRDADKPVWWSARNVTLSCRELMQLKQRHAFLLRVHRINGLVGLLALGLIHAIPLEKMVDSHAMQCTVPHSITDAVLGLMLHASALSLVAVIFSQLRLQQKDIEHCFHYLKYIVNPKRASGDRETIALEPNTKDLQSYRLSG